MSTIIPKRLVVPVLLAVAFVNPALLAQVAGPAEGSRNSPSLTRRAFRRSRRTWLAEASRTHAHRQKADEGRGPDVGDAGPALASDGVAALVPRPARTEILAREPAALASVPRYLLYRTLLI